MKMTRASWGAPGANPSDEVTDRVLRFKIRILISMHGKTSDPNTPLHYPALTDLWTEDTRVCVSPVD